MGKAFVSQAQLGLGCDGRDLSFDNRRTRRRSSDFSVVNTKFEIIT